MSDKAATTQPPPFRFSDRDLLRRFVQDGDERAFAEIVERHAGLVMSVCRRVVGQSADVDDAFQATFFALSRRPDGIEDCQSLSGWLYSVAWRTSVRLVRLRKRSRMQPLPEQMIVAEIDPLDQISEASDLATLDEELNQLPQKYRDVLVMSYFAQQTNQEIADQLNDSKGAIDGRIRDARRMLRVRLARRGVEIGALLIAASGVQASASAASLQLMQTTCEFGKMSSGWSGAEQVTGVDLAKMKLLTSGGTSIMSIHTGFAVVAAMIALSGFFGAAQLSHANHTSGDGDGATGSPAVIQSTTAAVDTDDAKIDQTVTILNRGAAALNGEAAASSSADAVPPESAAATAPSEGPAEPDPFSSELTTTVSTSTSQSSNLSEAAPATRSSSGGRNKGAKAEFSRRSARAAEEKIHEMMANEMTPALNYPGENSLADILTFLESSLAEDRGQTVHFMLDETDPDIGQVGDFLETTMVANVELPEDSMSLESAMELIFAKVKDQTSPLTWVVRNEVILIVTAQTANSEDNLLLRSYDISRLRTVFPDSTDNSPFHFAPETPRVGRFGGGGGGGGGLPGSGGGSRGGNSDDAKSEEKSSPRTQPDPFRPAEIPASPNPVKSVTRFAVLVETVRDMTVPPCRWVENGDEIGTMAIAGNRLLVRQTRIGHQKVAEVLQELEEAASDFKSEEPFERPVSAN